MTRFLITTALEDTWREDQPVLFLGQWCRRFSRRDRWRRLDAEVLPYHWDDRARLHADYQYLSGFYERLLADLALRLNEIHGVDHGLRYWRIVIGPWLGYFVQILFDRWSSIRAALAHDLSGTIVLSGSAERLVPNDMIEFLRLMAGDEWNHHIYGQLLRRVSKVPLTTRERGEADSHRQPEAPVRGPQQLRSALAAAYTGVCGSLVRDGDAFLIGTLPPTEEVKLQLRLGQVPQHWQSPPPSRSPIDVAQRDWVVRGQSESEYEECARALIPAQLPGVWLEGYAALQEQAAGLPWPKHPSVIWAGGAENSDDVFKAWAALKVEEGTPLVISQHGGHYGIGRWSFNEDHETAISDRYLSWGWSDRPNIAPIGQTRPKRPLGVRHADQPGALLVLAVVPRYSYWMYSIVVAGQWLDYLEDQYAFVSHLPPAVQQALTVRTAPNDYGRDQAARWADRFPAVRVDAGRVAINDLIRQSRIYISTYNATTYLESFTMDVPTVIYWNQRHWEVRDSAVPYFDELARVGIFHDTPESAARHVTAIWDDVETWWTSAAVREVVQRFKDRYCHIPKDPLRQVAVELRAAAASAAQAMARA